MRHDDGFDDLADRVAELHRDLDDRAFTVLREAAREGRGRPDADKRLTQARRALEKAERLLRNVGGGVADDDSIDD